MTGISLRPNFCETSAPSRIDKVWGAMMDIMSQRYSGGTFFAPEPDTEYPSDIRDSIKYLKELRGCEWRPWNTSFSREMRSLLSV